MKVVEKIFGQIFRVHAACARWGTAFFGWFWRFQGKFPLPLKFFAGFLGLALMAAASAFVFGGYEIPPAQEGAEAVRFGHWYVALGGFDDALVRYLENAGHLAAGQRLAWVALGVAALCLLAALFAFVRVRFSFRLMQAAWAAFGALWLAGLNWTTSCGSILLACDHKAYDSVTRNEFWTGTILSFLAAVPWPALLLLALLFTAVRRRYGLGMPSVLPDAGERLVENLRTGGKDPRFRSSLYWTLTLFFLALFLPFLIFTFGWEDPYGLPQGGGEMVVEQVKVKKQKKKKKKKLTVNPWSPYILERMNIDDVKTLDELETETQDMYVAQQTKSAGGKGKGTGGWPKGMENSAVRFIRLEYRGGDWNQDMGHGSDYNLLIKFHQWTGMKIAKDTEHRPIERLKYFPKKLSPPFVFLTGMGGISVSEREVKALREYCLTEGGMLFIDNGGGHFGGSVRQLLARVFPGKRLVDIPNDDAIFQRPYVFPDGAPPLWHHDGSRALGIRDEGRWVVFYHPGDVNDAWKDDHSGVSAEVADQAYKIGVNVMYYAFNQYYSRHYEQE